MLRNYLRIGLRNLVRNRTTTVVNVLGLSVAIACAITVYLFLERAYTMDRFHVDAERIFLVENVVDRNGRERLFGDTPMPMGPALVADIPQVEEAVRVAYGGANMRVGDRVFREGLWYVDPAFPRFFSFPLKYGDPSALDDANGIVLSEALATRYFGDANPVGRQVSLSFSDTAVEEFTVGAVAARFPTKASFTFNALIPYEKQKLVGVDVTDWGGYTGATFIRTTTPEDIAEVATHFERYRAIQNAANDDWPVTRFEWDVLHDLSLRSQEMSSDISNGTHPTAVIVLALVALFMLLLSCFNTMNLAMATAARRLREIGVRKALGSSRAQLVSQILGENLLLTFVSLGLGFVLAWLMFIPGFNRLFDFVGGSIALGEASTGLFWLFLVALMVLTAVLSGAYPAFYVASFRPVAILRGTLTLSSRSLLTRSLLAVQFVLAFLTMIMGVILAQNADYQSTRDWGYAEDHELVVQTSNREEYSVMRNAVADLPGVVSVAGSQGQFGRSWQRPVIEIEGRKMDVVRFAVGPGYLQQYGLRLVAGRLLEDRETETAGTEVVLNERFVEALGWTSQDAIGRSFREDSLSRVVVGVVADYLYDSIYDPLEPAFFSIASAENLRFLSLAVEPGAASRTAETVEATWKRIFPDRPYNGFFQDTVFDRVNRESTNIKHLFEIIAALALLVACLGLFGMAMQTTIRRMREISIRKILGASVAGITQVVSRSFLIVIAIAATIATPLGYVGMNGLLESVYSDPIRISAWPFVLSYALVLGAATATILTQMRRIAANDPAAVLRAE